MSLNKMSLMGVGPVYRGAVGGSFEFNYLSIIWYTNSLLINEATVRHMWGMTTVVTVWFPLLYTYCSQTNEKAEKFKRTLKSILIFYEKDNHSDWDAHFSTLALTYRIEVHCSTNNWPFYPMSNQRILDFTFQFTVAIRKIFTAPEQWPGFSAAPQHSIDSACAWLPCTRENYIRDFFRSVRKGRLKIRSDVYVFVDVLEWYHFNTKVRKCSGRASLTVSEVPQVCGH